MKATVLAPVSINGIPAKIGDAVEVDDLTFANLSRKGKLTEDKAETAPSKSQEIETREPETENRDPKHSRKSK